MRFYTVLRIVRVAAAALAVAAQAPALASNGDVGADGRPGPWSVAAFGGVLLDNTYEEVLLEPWVIDTESAQIFGTAVAVRLAEPVRGLEFGLEAQLNRHFGAQTHWEMNGPIATARWTRFPWSDHVATGAAFGLGLSVTSETPALEVANEGGSQPLMAYWMIEIGLAPPRSDWELIGRLHHRSTAFGTFGDEGGSNALVLGIRHHF